MSKASVERHFVLPCMATGHSLQGQSRPGIVIFELDFYHADPRWMLVAATRSRDLSRVLIYDGPIPRAKLKKLRPGVQVVRNDRHVDLGPIRRALGEIDDAISALENDDDTVDAESRPRKRPRRQVAKDIAKLKRKQVGMRRYLKHRDSGND